MINTFRSIDDLVKTLEREKVLLKAMFDKRKSLSFKYNYAQELTDYKEDRIRHLIENGVIRESGNFLELEDIYLKFFEEVLQVNEEINVAFVQDYINNLNENIDYYLKENNEQRKYGYQREVKRCLKQIALTTVRNVLDLKRNLDITYKTEPNYQIKLTKLKRLDEKRKNIALLITKSEDVIDNKETVFFKLAMDVQMREVVSDVKLQLADSFHNLLEIEKQIVHYLNLIAYQNRIFEKVRKLKYLRDQFLLTENTNIQQVVNEKNPVWMEPQMSYRIKLSVDYLLSNSETIALIRKVLSKRKEKLTFLSNVADALPDEYLKNESQLNDAVNLQEVYNAFSASGTHLFRFLMNYEFKKQISEDERILFFCQIASQYTDNLEFTSTYESNDRFEYPLVYFHTNL